MGQRSLVKFLMLMVLSWSTPAVAAADKSEAKIDSKLSRADEKFVREVADGGLMEVELGRIATERATHEQVKAFARQVQEDRGKSNEELKTIAVNKGIELRKSLKGTHRRTIGRLAKLAGAEFDRQYMQLMVEDHRQDIEKYQREADNGKDPDIRQFASKQIPVLKKHLEMAKAVDRQVRESSRSTPGGGLPHPNNLKTAAYESSFP